MATPAPGDRVPGAEGGDPMEWVRKHWADVVIIGFAVSCVACLFLTR